MTSPAGTIRLYRPDPNSICESKRCGRATFTVHPASPGRIRIAAYGDVDAVNGRALGHYVEAHTGTSQQLVLDLRAVDFFGTQGFTALYYISVQCTRRDVDWMLVGSPPVHRLLRICDTSSELPLCTDLASALARLDQITQCRGRIASAG
ncbi:STAS domain-containing protein [[Mycobacterium] burgundiense]|jgi:anti-anti-sigma factor|uniref:STAS domain-containing protein n=1 Tax=[Mycobacterium] burgundiense TaxID=3064286 RepID=A0ABN9NWD1_9MYCO|nr:STAS domain-containing protein [Mycolicibacterium sp. MU0053]CAJ1510636.1 STAS domain-containing protein [Mycolicibacterium sp. MU0053]